MCQQKDEPLNREEGKTVCENQLRLYKSFFHSSREALIITNEHLEMIEINQSACDMLQINREVLAGENIFDVLWQVPSRILEQQMKLIKSNGNLMDEWLLVDYIGRSIHIEFHAMYRDDAYFFSFRDITAYKKNEKEYTISTQMFKDVFSQVTDGIIIFDRKSCIVDVNDFFLKLVDIPKDVFEGEEFTYFLSEESKRKWDHDWNILMDTGKMTGIVELLINNKTYFFEYRIYMNSYNHQFISIFKDVTKKKLIELQLKQSKEIFSYIFEEAIDAIILTDEYGVIQKVNDVACRIFEQNHHQLIGRELVKFIPNKDKKYNNMLHTFIQTGAVREELFFHMPNGQTKLLEFTSKRLEIQRLNVTILRNVSERHELDKKLRKSEKRFRKIFNGMKDGLLLWKHNQIVDINEAGLAIIDYPKRKLLSMTIQQMIGAVPGSKNELEEMFQKIKKQNCVEEIIPFTFKDGKNRYIEFSTRKNLVSGLNLTVFKDVTEKLELQEQLRKSDTLSVVGELAAGIAHEIRNPMTALKGFIQLLQSSVQEDFSSYFTIISSELKRIDTIITEFLVLAKPQAIQYQEKDLNVIVKDTIDLLNAESVLYNIDIKTNYSDENLFLRCEPNQLKQVFINIIKNAIESMGNGGTVKVTTKPYKDGFINIIMEDEGGGIPKEKLKKLGEPFYTTKDRGTGLGLMVSYKIIEEHQGWIEVKSTEGKGSIFSIFLPCHADFKMKGIL